jgi:AraC-like DNA-binding protein
MSPSPPPVNRFFISPQYSLNYRRVKRLDGSHPARSDYTVVAVLDGALTFTTEARHRLMSRGQALLLGPSIGASLTGHSVEVLQLNLAPALVVDHAFRMHLSRPGTTVAFRLQVVEQDDRLSELVRNLATEVTDEKPGREIVLGALVEQVLVHLLRSYSNMRRSDHLELSRVGLIDRRIRRSVELMHDQLDQELSLKEIAAASYLSPFHFVRVFKKLTGTTPHAYLASIRASRAQLLLGDPNLSVTEISSRVGYSSPSHFTKAFRQATGLTPRAFRKALVSG